MAKAKPRSAPQVTRQDLERYFTLEEKRLHLGRLAKAVLSEMGELEERFTELVHALDGPEKAVRRCGYLLKLNQQRVSVKWKDEFIAVTSAEKAAEIAAAQPTKDVLVVEPPPQKEKA